MIQTRKPAITACREILICATNFQGLTLMDSICSPKITIQHQQHQLVNFKCTSSHVWFQACNVHNYSLHVCTKTRCADLASSLLLYLSPIIYCIPNETSLWHYLVKPNSNETSRLVQMRLHFDIISLLLWHNLVAPISIEVQFCVLVPAFNNNIDTCGIIIFFFYTWLGELGNFLLV